jgi:hypothetical protein
MRFSAVSTAVFSRVAGLYIAGFSKHYEERRVQVKPHHQKGVQGIAGFNIGIDGDFAPLPLRETMEAIQSFNING